MKFSPLLLMASCLALFQQASALQMIESNSLNTCQGNSSFTASLFDVVFTPGNSSISFDVVGVSSIQGNVTFDVALYAYGYEAIHENIDPCVINLAGLCPMSTGQIDINANEPLPSDVTKQIPSIVYGIPDIDAYVKVHILSKDTGVSQGCVEAMLSNGQTVDQQAVGWSTAVISGLALVASAVTSGLGHSNTAAHVAANALSLFGYLQGQAIFGMSSVTMPPIVQAWTQNFDWTMGIIEVDFMQDIATWYQRSTGGQPATLLNTLTTTSVQVEKRSLAMSNDIASVTLPLRALKRSPSFVDRAASGSALVARSNNNNKINEVTGTYIVRGIKRVGFRASIEPTNIFLTGLIFFCVFVGFTIILVALFKGVCELAVKARWMQSDKFIDFRNGWLTVLKGIMYRMVLIGFPQMTILCLWELTQLDSPAEAVLAVAFFLGMSATLGFAAFKVIRIAKRSVEMHQNPAYILYSDPSALNKWGFLYVQFRATAYYAIVPFLLYILVKGMTIAFAQGSPITQAIVLLIVEAAALIAASVIRPWMDKSTNSFNISICAINFFNSILLLIFTNVFNLPGLVPGVLGVVFFVVNAAFALVLLILVLIATGYAIFRKNPDTRYQPMTDDRASFIKSQTNLTTELDALGATARGEMKGGYKHGLDLDDERRSWSSESLARGGDAAGSVVDHNGITPLASTVHGGGHGSMNSSSSSNIYGASPIPPHSPIIDPSVPLFPSENLQQQRGPPPTYSDNPRAPYKGYSENRPTAEAPLMGPGGGDRSVNSSPAPYGGSARGSNQAYRDNGSSSTFRQQNNSSPWQRGAGYDH